MSIAYDGVLLSNNRKITSIIFFVLLSSYFFAKELTKDLYFSLVIILPLLLLVIWINKKEPHKIRVDRLFLIVFFVSNFIFCFYYWNRFPIIPLLFSLILFYTLFFDDTVSYDNQSTLLKSLVVFYGLIPIILFSLILRINFQPFLSNEQFLLVISVNLWSASYKIMLCWGISQKVLENLKINNIIVFLIPVIAFLLTQISIFPSKTFFVTLPLLSLWLGYLVFRSKSLVPAIITYFAYNIVANIIKFTVTGSF